MVGVFFSHSSKTTQKDQNLKGREELLISCFSTSLLLPSVTSRRQRSDEMTGEESLVWGDELGLSCRRSLLPGVVDVSAGQAGTLGQLIHGAGQGIRDPSCRSLSRCSSIESAEFSGN